MALGTLLETKDGITGEVRTYKLAENFVLVPNDEKKSENSPSHTIIMKGLHGKKFDAGVAWEQSHPKVGRYFSLDFSIPELLGDEGLRCGAFGDGKGQGAYNIVKDRPQTQQQAA